MAHPPAPQLIVSPAERAVLDRLVRARTSEQRLAQRARIVIRAADGVANKRISAELGVNLMTVLLWRRRFEAERLAGLRDAPRPGRTPTYTRADRDRVIALTLEPPTDGTTHWSARRIASRVGIPAERGDPLGQMKISTRALAQGVKKDATALLTACGLALRSFD
mgnify:CR=1 FL=1